MNYLTSGHRTFNFMITPDELESLLSTYHLVIHNCRVPQNYTETPISDYLENYAALYHMQISGQKIEWMRDYHYFEEIGVTSDLSRCKYGAVFKKRDGIYRLADFDEPVPTISPMALTIQFDSEHKLHCSTSFAYMQFPECFMGLKLSYPSRIQYRANGDAIDFQTTVGLSGYADYTNLVTQVKSITSGMTLHYEHGTKAPGIRISKQVKAQLGSCYLFNQYGISI